MGAHPYWYLIPHCSNPQAALDDLRLREFVMGRYSPVIRFLKFSEPAFSEQVPGASHESIEEAVDAAGEAGTRSILDIRSVSPTRAIGSAAPLRPTRLLALFGTTKPTREDVLGTFDVFEDIDRGTCVYTAVYVDGAPMEWFFAGYSID